MAAGGTTIGDVIEIARVPPVVSLTQLADLRTQLDRGGPLPAGTEATLSHLLEQYLVVDGGNLAAVEVLFRSLGAAEGKGAGFLLHGPHGAGKSHFLTLLGLLLEYPQAWAAFSRTHPEYEPIAEAWQARGRMLVVPVPLDEHRGSRELLEDIVFDRTEEELRRPKHGCEVPLSERSYALELVDRHLAPQYEQRLTQVLQAEYGPETRWQDMRAEDPDRALRAARRLVVELGYPLDFRQSRIERLARLLEVLRRHDWTGIVWLLDDLALFLSGMEPKSAHNDCAFLHFLGQRTKISPLWVIGTLQEEIDSLGDIEAAALTQIKDRYNTRLSLSIAQMREVLAVRVIQRRDPGTFAQAVALAAGAYSAHFPGLELEQRELTPVYPLHPLTVQCLEACARHIFSQTRSIVDFAQTQVAGSAEEGVTGRLGDDVRQLVGPDAIYDHFAVAISKRSETAAYANQVYEYYANNVHTLVPDDAPWGLRLIKALIVCRLAGLDVPLAALTQATQRLDEQSDEPPLDRARRVLEILRLQGSFIDVLRRGEEPGQTVYVVDVASNVAEQLRRRLNVQKSILADDDPLLIDEAMAACVEESLPLAELSQPRQIEVEWCHTARVVGVELRDLSTLDASQLVAAATNLGDLQTAEVCHLFVGRLEHPARQARRWRELCAGLAPSRWAYAMAAWLPRALAPAEVDVLKEYAAYRLLLDEPALREDPRARSLLARLQEQRIPRERTARAIVESAYYEGEVLGLGAPLLDANQLGALRPDWATTLQALVAPALEKAFPLFPQIASRRRLGDSEGDMLVEQFIRRGRVERDADPVVAEAIESILLPLGLASRAEGALTLQAAERGIVAAALDRIRQRDAGKLTERGRVIPCAELAQHFAKSEFGLPPELFELVIAALLRLGYLLGLDAEQNPVPFAEVPCPLAAHVHFVARAPLLSYEQWQLLSRAARWFLDVSVMALDAPTQEATWQGLVEARRSALPELQATEQRLTRLREALGQPQSNWRDAYALIAELRGIFLSIDEHVGSAPGIIRFLEHVAPLLDLRGGAPGIKALLSDHERLRRFLEDGVEEITGLYRYGADERLNEGLPAPLAKAREKLLSFISEGERAVREPTTLRRLGQSFLAAYRRQYLAWHIRAYHGKQFDAYRQLLDSSAFQALQALSASGLAVQNSAARVRPPLEAQLGGQCTEEDLEAAIARQPFCPGCGVRLGELPETQRPDELAALIQEGLSEYARALRTPERQQAIVEYAAGLTGKSDLQARLQRLANLPADPSPREILLLLEGETAEHLRRALSGRALRPRRLEELAATVRGRTLSKAELLEHVEQWLGGEEGLAADEMLRIE